VWGASGAPQQAVVAAVALGLVVIPYVFTRGVEGLFTPRAGGDLSGTVACPQCQERIKLTAYRCCHCAAQVREAPPVS
jgi:hypothetical protein